MKKSKIVTIGLVALSINMCYGINKNILNDVSNTNEKADLHTENVYQQNPKTAADTTRKNYNRTGKTNSGRGGFSGFFRRSNSKTSTTSTTSKTSTTRSVTRGGFGKAATSSNS